MNLLPTITQLRQQPAAPGGHEARLRAVRALADEPAAAAVFTARFDAQALATAQAADRLQAQGAPLLPLAGLPVTVKDLYDVAGRTTMAGSVLREPRSRMTRAAVQASRKRGPLGAEEKRRTRRSRLWRMSAASRKMGRRAWVWARRMEMAVDGAAMMAS
jgi:hypothetical protein